MVDREGNSTYSRRESPYRFADACRRISGSMKDASRAASLATLYKGREATQKAGYGVHHSTQRRRGCSSRIRRWVSRYTAPIPRPAPVTLTLHPLSRSLAECELTISRLVSGMSRSIG